MGVEKRDPQEPQPLRMGQRGGVADQFFLRIVLVQPVQCAQLKGIRSRKRLIPFFHLLHIKPERFFLRFCAGKALAGGERNHQNKLCPQSIISGHPPRVQNGITQRGKVASGRKGLFQVPVPVVPG